MELIDKPFEATIMATDPKGEVTYTTKAGETEADARKAAIRWGVAYYLYDNKHITGPNSAMEAAKQADRMNEVGDRLEYDGFTFEFAALAAA